MNIPPLNIEQTRTYVFYIGEPIGTVGLWKRYQGDDGGEEYPIYQNTRGRGIWNSCDTATTNQDCEHPTDAFWRVLEQLTNGQRTLDGGFDVEDCYWYEIETLESVMAMATQHDADDLPVEIGGLLAYAESGRWEDE